MPSVNWRGTIGVIKPGYGTASLVEFIRLMPEGVGCIPKFVGIREHSHQEYLDAFSIYDGHMRELAKLMICDLLHPEGAPPFMLRGVKGEREIIEKWETEYRVPVFTSGMTQTAALKALGVKRVLGITYETREMNDIFATYFTDAGFEVLVMEEAGPRPGEGRTVAAEDVYALIKRAYLRHPEADGIYLQGSGPWGYKDVLPLEQDLGIPVLHPVAARVWYVQKQLRVREPVMGAGRILEEMP